MGLLERVDRMQLAVNDRTAAEDTFARLFGAERARLDESAYLNAWRTVLSIGGPVPLPATNPPRE